MFVEGAQEAISDAERGAELIAKSARSLNALAHVSGGEGAAAIIAPALAGATAAAKEGAEMLAGIIQSIVDVDETTNSVVDVNTYVIWCGVSFSAVGGLANASTLGLIEAAERIANLTDDKRAAAAAREDARQGGLLLLSASKALSTIMAALTDPQSERNRGVYKATSQDDQDDSEGGEGSPVYFGIEYLESEPNRVVVDEVDADSPAAVSGLEVGDTITALDTYAVDGIESFDELLSGRAPGDVVAVTVRRGKRSLSLSVKLGNPIDD